MTYLDNETINATQANNAINNIVGMMSTGEQIDNVVKVGRQTAVLLGDSITAANYIVSPTSGAKYYSTGGFFTWLQCLSGHAFNVVNYAGIPGETSSQILARVDSDVIPYNPEWCFLLCGMNDASGPAEDLLLQNNIIAIYEKCNLAGIKLVILTNTATSTTTGKNQQVIKINGWMQKYFADKDKVIIVDAASATRDPLSTTGAVASNTTYDGIHPSNNGGYLLGKKIYDSILPFIRTNYKYLPKSIYDTTHLNTYSSNYFKFPLFTGSSSGGFHYTLPSYYRTLSNATMVGTIEAAKDGIGNSQVIDVTATGASVLHSGNVILDFDSLLATDAVSVGSQLYATCVIEIDEGAVNFAVATLGLCSEYGKTAVIDLSNINAANAIAIPSGGLKLNLRTPIYTVVNASNTFFNRVLIMFAGAGNAKIRISKMAIVKVN